MAGERHAMCESAFIAPCSVGTYGAVQGEVSEILLLWRQSVNCKCASCASDFDTGCFTQLYLATRSTTVLTYSIEQSPSWEANRFLASQEFPPHFMEPEGSLPQSQVPAACPYPEPDSFPSTPANPTFWGSILILSSHLPLVLSVHNITHYTC